MRRDSCTVLVVDDSPEDRAVYRRYLEQNKECRYRVLEVDRGELALKACREQRLDCIVLDYSLPDTDGLAVLDSLVHQARSDRHAVVMLTGSGRTSVAVQALKTGALDYLDKNEVTAEQLHRSIHYAIEKVTLQRELEHQRRWFQGTLSSIGEAVIATDRTGQVTFINAMAENLTGWPGGSAMKRPIEEVYTVVSERTRQPLGGSFIGMILKGKIGSDEPALLLARNGREVPIDHSGTPIRDAKGEIIGGVIVARDTTRRRRTEAALREREERFSLVARATGDALWDWDVRANRIWCNEAYEALFVRPPLGTGRTGQWWSERIHPDDRARVSALTSTVLNNRDETWICNYRCRRRDSTYADIMERAFIVRDAEGQAVRVLAAMVDLTEGKRAESALKESDRRKDNFLAILAHELRNPLAPIQNAVDVLRRGDSHDATTDWARDVIERQVSHLTRLVDDLLDVSRITRDQITLDKEVLELKTVVDRAVETSRPLIEARGHQFTISLPSQPVRLKGDLVRLAQAIANLLNNAAKYTEKGGRIALEAESRQGHVLVCVRDSGVGIAPDSLERIFDPFSQAHLAENRSQGGLGIGLSLVQKLVAMHGGTVEAHSRGLGQGSEFRVRLPLYTGSTPRALPSRQASGSKAPPAPCRILVVDDNADAVESLTRLLRLQGHAVQTAMDGPSAIELARAFQPQVVLLDIGLPGVDGYRTAGDIRAQPGMAEVMLIALTGYGQEADRQRAKAAGFDHHVVKPAGLEEIEELLAAYAGSKANAERVS